MATIAKLLLTGELIPIDAQLDGNTRPWRRMYGTKVFIRWLDEQLPRYETSLIGNDLSPVEQVYALLAAFAGGEPLVVSRQFKQLRPSQDAVWELKTDDVRIFGWFPHKDSFVAVNAGFADTVKDYNLYAAFRREVVAQRTVFDLPQGYVESNEVYDVISVKTHR